MEEETPKSLSFAWWNLHNFAHYDIDRHNERRWPTTHADYFAKRDRILEAFSELFGEDYPDILAVCEITRGAAEGLIQDLPSTFEFSFPPSSQDADFQVAVFYRTGAGITAEPPVFPTETEDVPRATRAMVPVHFRGGGHLIRFVACHWTAFQVSRVIRERLADFLRRNSRAFLFPEVPASGIVRHLVVLGDLNEEPTADIFEERFIGKRDHASTRQREHWRDADVQRIRLYNAAWRYFGEQVPHGSPQVTSRGIAGTKFSSSDGWQTFDHVFISAGLLQETPPYFDETNTRVRATPIMLDGQSRPTPFQSGSGHGVSDHLPIVGRIVLSEATE